MSAWLEQLDDYIRTRKLFRDGQGIVVAVSGGLDSMVLLHALVRLAPQHGWKLGVAHFNHQLRGRASDADETLVRRTAKKLQLPIFVGTKNVKAFAKQKRLSIEMAARRLRHDFLAAAARKMERGIYAASALTEAGASKNCKPHTTASRKRPEGRAPSIALAHHADDQVELFFLRVLRGASGGGLSGMSVVSRSSSDFEIEIVRPLFKYSKEDLMKFAEEEQIVFREDASNAQLEFQRNRIRHEVIPLLKKIQPALNETVLRTMDIVGRESNFVLDAALDWLASKKRMQLDKLDVAVQRKCLYMQLRGFNFPADFDLVETLRLHPNRAVAINPKISVQRDLVGTVSWEVVKKISFGRTREKMDLSTQKSVEFAGCELAWTFEGRSGTTFQRKPNCEFFDADRVGQRIILRYWKRGDRFQPIGMKVPVKVQDLFVNQKILRARRHKLIVAVSESGEIFWIQGLRIGENFKLRPDSQRRLCWQWADVRGDNVREAL